MAKHVNTVEHGQEPLVVSMPSTYLDILLSLSDFVLESKQWQAHR